MTTDTALQAADAVFMAEQSVGRARRVVDELHTTINSALRVLDDAELDSAKARLSDRGDHYLEAAGEHLSRLQRRCSDNAELVDELTRHLERASQAIADAHDLLQVAETSDPELASEVAQLKPRLAVVGEMIELAKPMARLTAQHVDSAQLAAQHVTPPSLLEPVTLERSIATAGKDLGRADEDVRLLENVVDHAAANARHRQRDHRQRPPAYGRAGPRPGSPPGRPGQRVAGAVGGRTGMDLDQGGRQLAGLVLDAAGRGQHDQVADLIAPLDADQLRSLVSVLAVQVDQTMPSAPATGPAAVCELAINTAAPMFGTTPEAILSAERSRPVSDARAVAMTAAREVGLSLPAIAEHFNKDHGSVIHAVRRTAERPRLADAAARVSEHVNDRYTARLPRPEATVVSLHQDPPASTFEPDGPVEHAVVAAAEAFGTTPEVLLGADRSRAAADARAVAMTAARIHGHSLPTIARHFDRDHTTVLHATRRIEKTPPLRDLAAKIAAELPEAPAAAGVSGADGVEQIPEPGYRSPGARAQERAVPVAGERPQLRVAR